MKKIVRESKFRHLFGNFSPKDQIYDGIVAKDSRLDGDIVAVNKYFIAAVLDSSNGSVFTVLSRRKPGRVDQYFRCIGHTSEIVDLAFNPFNPLQIASSCEDGCAIVWNIPLAGLTEDIEDYQSQLKSSQRRAVLGLWHPSAGDVFILANVDSINIFNTLTADLIRSINTSGFCDQIFNFALNNNGTQCVVSSRDKKVRTFDLMTGKKLVEFPAHEGSKPIKVAWVTGDFEDHLVVTTGATKMSGRQISVWDLRRPTSSLYTEALDNATSPLYIRYDPDTKLIICYGKGETSIRFYEFDMKPEPRLHLVSTISCPEAHRAIGFGDKFSGNITANVVILVARVLAKSIDEVSCTVPRRSDLFQEDLFPDTRAETPAITAEEFQAGKTADPVLVSLRDYVAPEPVVSNVSRAATTTKSRTSENRASGVKGGNRPVSASFDVRDQLLDLVQKVERLQERVDKLEGK